MFRSFKTEIDPTPEQIVKINRTMGTCRFIYNFFIAKNKVWYENGEQFMRGHAFNVWMNHEFLPNNPDYMWIKEVNTSAVKRSIDDADHAFQKFFKKKGGFPKFKKKSGSDVKMYFYRKGSRDCECERHRIKIPSLGWVRLKEKGYIPTTAEAGWIKSGRISKRAGRYYVSVLLDVPDESPSAPAEMTDGIGLHLGIRELALTSTGVSYENINKTEAVKKLEKKLRREHRRFSRKLENEKRGGATQGRNIEKQKLKLQRIYRRISNIRDNYIDQTIAQIVKTKPSFIAISDINVTLLMKNKYVAKYLAGQKLRRFRERLTSKCHELGIELRIAEKSFRSASICSSCGKLNKNASISSDKFKCSCGYCEDRSLNASYNLRDMLIYSIG